ncbi:MAG: right-handed parallel beta-helix repeat-containing protein [Proteobacteria bacterium]|nr:right-handed parallel beta-helix repeat-containing protein [Pseudomonadota bacterium]
MHTPKQPIHPRHTALALGVASLLGLAAPAAMAAPPHYFFLTNCGDSGPGSLRSTIPFAASGDVITGANLNCSTITLTSGAIAVTQDNLQIISGKSTPLEITMGPPVADRVFTHTGAGTLELDQLKISGGYLTRANGNGVVAGGCVYSRGNVKLDHTGVYGCTATAYGNTANGGGIYALGTATLTYSTVSGNSAYLSYGSASRTSGSGGGIYAHGVTLTRSTVSGNSVGGHAANQGGYGGGIFSAGGSASASYSTISGNFAATYAGGAFLQNATPVKITNSTISGNSAAKKGGIYAHGLISVTIANSTIVGNSGCTSANYAAGLTVRFAAPSPLQGSLNLQSTLIANNTCGPNTENDLSVSGPGTLTGANNLVRISAASLPSDTITGPAACPLLGPLRNNGGPTWTHAMLSGSPGLAQGNNSAGLSWDQRTALFQRLSKAPPGGTAPAAPDIGAYEMQRDDIIFDTGFDGCPALIL